MTSQEERQDPAMVFDDRVTQENKAQDRWQASEAEFQRDLKRVSRYVKEMPFGAIFGITIKFIIAFWLANIVIVLALYLLLASLGTSLVGLSPGS